MPPPNIHSNFVYIRGGAFSTQARGGSRRLCLPRIYTVILCIFVGAFSTHARGGSRRLCLPRIYTVILWCRFEPSGGGTAQAYQARGGSRSLCLPEYTKQFCLSSLGRESSVVGASTALCQ